MVRNILLAIVAIFLIIATWQLLGPWAIIIYALAGIAVWLYYRNAYILIDEMKYGVVFDRLNDKFLFFVDENGFFIGEHYLKRYKTPQYRHHLQPHQEVKGTIPKGTVTANDTTDFLRTKEGFPVRITWMVDAFFDPHDILPGIEHKMGRALPNVASKMLGKKMRQELRRIIEEKSIEDLYQYSAESGGVKCLEDEVQTRVSGRIKALGGIVKPNDVIIGPIELPDEVEKALRAKYQRELQGQTLQKLHELARNLNEEDIAKLRALEGLRILENNDALVYMMDSLASGGPSGPPTSGQPGGVPRHRPNMKQDEREPLPRMEP